MKAQILKIKTTNDSIPFKYGVGIEGIKGLHLKTIWMSKQTAKKHMEYLQSDLNAGLVRVSA